MGVQTREIRHFDSIVVGGGIAGLAAAKRLGELGLQTALVEKKSKDKPSKKSLFINGENIPPELITAMEERGGLTACPDFLLINIDHPGRGVYVPQAANTHAISHDHIVQYGREQLGPNVTAINDRITGSTELDTRVEVSLAQEGVLHADTLVDASGSYSQVSRNHLAPDGKPLLTDNPYVLWVKGIHGNGTFKPGVMINPIGRDLGISWTMAYSSTQGDIVACDNSRMFPGTGRDALNPRRQQDILTNLRAYCADEGLAVIDEVDYGFSSVIRAEPIPRSAARRTRRVYPIGEAGGMGEPHMNEVIPVALHWGERVGDFIAEGRTPLDFYTQWRHKEKMFPYDKSLAMLYRRIRKERRGEYGSGAGLYQALADEFPQAMQHEIFRTRKLKAEHLPYIARAVRNNPRVVRTLVEIAAGYTYVKARTAVQR